MSLLDGARTPPPHMVASYGGYSVMDTLDDLFQFMERWIGPRPDDAGVSLALLDTTPMPQPLRRLLAHAGAWEHPHRPGRVLDSAGFNLFVPPFGTVDGVDGFWFATDRRDGWQATTTPDSSVVTVVFEGSVGSEPLEPWLVRLCLRALVYGGPWREDLWATEKMLAERVQRTEPFVSDLSPLASFGAARKEPLWLIDDRILATPRPNQTARGPVAAARDVSVLEDLHAQFDSGPVEVIMIGLGNPMAVRPGASRAEQIARLGKPSPVAPQFEIRPDGSCKFQWDAASSDGGVFDFASVLSAIDAAKMDRDETGWDGNDFDKYPPRVMRMRSGRAEHEFVGEVLLRRLIQEGIAAIARTNPGWSPSPKIEAELARLSEPEA